MASSGRVLIYVLLTLNIHVHPFLKCNLFKQYYNTVNLFPTHSVLTRGGGKVCKESEWEPCHWLSSW